MTEKDTDYLILASKTPDNPMEEPIEEKPKPNPKYRKAVLPELKEPFDKINQEVRAISGLNIENFTPKTKPLNIPIAIYDAMQEIAELFGDIGVAESFEVFEVEGVELITGISPSLQESVPKECSEKHGCNCHSDEN